MILDAEAKSHAGQLVQAADLIRPGPWRRTGHEVYEGTPPCPHWQVYSEPVAEFLVVARNVGPGVARCLIDTLADRDRWRECLTWAVGFIRCQMPRTAADYPDFRHAEDMAARRPLVTGEFQRAVAWAESAAWERDRFRAALERIDGMPFAGVDAAANMVAEARKALEEPTP